MDQKLDMLPHPAHLQVPDRRHTLNRIWNIASLKSNNRVMSNLKNLNTCFLFTNRDNMDFRKNKPTSRRIFSHFLYATIISRWSDCLFPSHGLFAPPISFVKSANFALSTFCFCMKQIIMQIFSAKKKSKSKIVLKREPHL